MAYITETHGLTASIFARVSEYFAGLAKSFSDARLYKQTWDELNRLSDAELYDLGLDRSQIAGIARQSVYGR